jgi:hypothetical protein
MMVILAEIRFPCAMLLPFVSMSGLVDLLSSQLIVGFGACPSCHLPFFWPFHTQKTIDLLARQLITESFFIGIKVYLHCLYQRAADIQAQLWIAVFGVGQCRG